MQHSHGAEYLRLRRKRTRRDARKALDLAIRENFVLESVSRPEISARKLIRTAFLVSPNPSASECSTCSHRFVSPPGDSIQWTCCRGSFALSSRLLLPQVPRRPPAVGGELLTEPCALDPAFAQRWVERCCADFRASVSSLQGYPRIGSHQQGSLDGIYYRRKAFSREAPPEREGS
jgi:hypothetical protein